MARKSRKIVQDMQLDDLKHIKKVSTAIYARLSVENSGKTDASDVIKNQIELCKKYVEEIPEFELIDIYADNGKTGTVFERPEFNRLMDDIRSGRIQCLVVKDLSRFGRDYVETGTYIERIFPMIGLRFISIKEKYDSLTANETNGALMIPLQNMINELYSKDISRKVSTALKTKINSGTYRVKNLSYGYMWDESRTHIIIDEEAAKYVRMIFQWKLEGVAINQMKRNLELLNAPTCDKRKYSNGVKSGTKPKGGRWAWSSIYGILTNQFYVGDTVHGKFVRALYKGEKQHRIKDSSQWICDENTHPAIISREKFQQVQEIILESSRTRTQTMENSKEEREKVFDLFQYKIFCKDCGRRLYVRRYKKYTDEKECYGGFYVCSTYSKNLLPSCTPHSINQSTVEERVLQAIQMQLKVALNYKKLDAKMKQRKKVNSINEERNINISTIRLKLNGMSKKRTKLYEDFVEGILTKDQYKNEKKCLDEEFHQLEVQLKDLENNIKNDKEAASSNEKWEKIIKSISGTKKLTQNMVDEMVEKVLVSEDGEIEIIMKYRGWE
ncbi:MAG: recombinase family protein [Eubacteriales bacterium]